MSTITYQTSRNYGIFRGDDFIKKFTTNNNSDPSYDYTGTSILFQMKADTEDTVALLQATPSPDVSTLGTIVVDLAIPGVQTANVSPGEYFFDIQYTLPDGRIRTYVTGRITVIADSAR
jgi:hypothetical protein